MSEIHIIPCGTLRVRADEMIKPVGADTIRKHYPVDPDGTLTLAMQALLVVHREKYILMDPGCADFLPGRLAVQYGLELEMSLEEALGERGVGPEKITDVIFTHLHFDHGSGAFQRIPGKIIKRFPQARYHVLKEHFEYAMKPHPSEADTFFTRFFRFIDPPVWIEDWKEEWISFKVFYGHTHGMVVPMIHLNGTITCYLSDLAPMALFLSREIFSGYDLHPETALREKQKFLDGTTASMKFIFFHDLLNKSMIYP